MLIAGLEAMGWRLVVAYETSVTMEHRCGRRVRFFLDPLVDD